MQFLKCFSFLHCICVMLLFSWYLWHLKSQELWLHLVVWEWTHESPSLRQGWVFSYLVSGQLNYSVLRWFFASLYNLLNMGLLTSIKPKSECLNNEYLLNSSTLTPSYCHLPSEGDFHLSSGWLKHLPWAFLVHSILYS